MFGACLAWRHPASQWWWYSRRPWSSSCTATTDISIFERGCRVSEEGGGFQAAFDNLVGRPPMRGRVVRRGTPASLVDPPVYPLSRAPARHGARCASGLGPV